MRRRAPRLWLALWWRQLWRFAHSLHSCFRYRERLLAESDELAGAWERSVDPAHREVLRRRWYDRQGEILELDAILPKRRS